MQLTVDASRRDSILAAVGSVVLGSFVSVVLGDDVTPSVEHQVRLTIPDAADFTGFEWNYFLHSWAREFDADDEDSTVNPKQGDGFDGFGREFINLDGNGGVSQLNNPGYSIILALQDGDIPDEGDPALSGLDRADTRILNGGSKATALAEFEISPRNGNIASAKYSASGTACAEVGILSPERAEAYSFAYSNVTLAAGFRDRVTGQIRTQARSVGVPVGTETTDSDRTWWDPAFVTIVDPSTGDILLREMLMSNVLSLHDGGSFLWEDGLLSLDAENADFTINIIGAFTAQEGQLELSIRDGRVVVSNDSGIFDGILPPLGFDQMIELAVGDFTLDFDMGDFGIPVEAQISIDNGISGYVSKVIPTPSTATLIAVASAIGAGRRRRSVLRRLQTPI